MYLETMLEDYLLELNLRNYSDRTLKSVRNTSRITSLISLYTTHQLRISATLQ